MLNRKSQRTTFESLTLLAALSLGVGCGAGKPRMAPAQPVPTPPSDTRAIKDVMVYAGPDALRVAVVRFEPPNADEALLEISGTRSELDSIVMPHTIVDDHYETTVHGTPYWTMRSRTRGGDWEVWFDGAAHQVVYDEAQSKAIDGAGLVRRHHEQVASGVIPELQRFNRDTRVQSNNEEFLDDLAHVEKECGFPVSGSIDWSTIDDELLKTYSVHSYCGGPASAVRTVCKRDSSFRDALAKRVKQVQCQFGDSERMELTDSGTLNWTISTHGSNLDEFARIQLMRQIVDDPLVLATGRGHYFFVQPVGIYDSVKDAKIYFGDDKVVRELRMRPGDHTYYRGQFWAPREDHEAAVELKDGSWTLKCGERSTALSVVSGDQRSTLLKGAEKQGPTWEREPYLLARDDRGNYYYIDRLRDGGKGFRVFRGPKGGVKLTKLVNIVEDAQGEIFATKTGRLRLVVDTGGEQTAWWLQGKRKVALVIVPVFRSQKLIYAELGAYDGEVLGTPCDEY